MVGRVLVSRWGHWFLLNYYFWGWKRERGNVEGSLNFYWEEECSKLIGVDLGWRKIVRKIAFKEGEVRGRHVQAYQAFTCSSLYGWPSFPDSRVVFPQKEY